MKKTYKNITISIKQSYVWFRFGKCGTSSVQKIFRDHTDINQEGHHAKELPYEYGDANYEKYFKFTVVRNPWSRLLSCYTNKIVEKERYEEEGLILDLRIRKVSFKEFVKTVTTDSNINKNIHWKRFYNSVPLNELDFIGRFENFQEDFNFICDKIGIPRQQLPHKNKSKHKHYTEYYDDETRQIVAEKYAKDIEYFGYKFGG